MPKIDKTISVGNLITLFGGVVVAVLFVAGWYFQTQSMAADQERQDTGIEKNKETIGDHEDRLDDNEVKFRGLEVRTESKFEEIQRQQNDIKQGVGSLNQKLDRLIDLQMRGPR